jgi:hypothetical protein
VRAHQSAGFIIGVSCESGVWNGQTSPLHWETGDTCQGSLSSQSSPNGVGKKVLDRATSTASNSSPMFLVTRWTTSCHVAALSLLTPGTVSFPSATPAASFLLLSLLPPNPDGSPILLASAPISPLAFWSVGSSVSLKRGLVCPATSHQHCHVCCSFCLPGALNSCF